MALQRFSTEVFEHMHIKLESGIFWLSKDFAERSSFSHWVVAATYSSGVKPVAALVIVPSGATIAGVPGTGRCVWPSKWPQNPLASIASRKRISKIAQLVPVLSSLGTEEGRVSERDVAVTDMVSTRFHETSRC